MDKPTFRLLAWSLGLLLSVAGVSLAWADDDEDPPAPPCAEGCDDPEPNQELEEPGPDDGEDDDGSGCSHRYTPRIGQPKVNPSATATIYHHSNGTTSLNGEHLKFKVGGQTALKVTGSFSKGVTWPEVPDPVLWETLEDRQTKSETKFTGEGGSGSVWEKTFTEKWDRKKVEAKHEEAWTIRRQYPVSCQKCGKSKKVTRTANPQKEATAEVSITVFTLKLQARRKGGGSFGDDAKIAAGALGSDVHVAEIEATLDPAGEDGDSYSFGVKVTADDPAYKPGPRQPHAPAWLTWDDNEGAFVGSITANHKGWVCEHDDGVDENNEPITVKHYYELVSSAKLGGATISGTGTGVDAGASVEFAWDEAEWEGGSFTPCVWEDVSLTLTADGEGVDGHGFAVTPKGIAAYFWVPSGSGGEGNWELVTLTPTQVAAVSQVFTTFRAKPEEEEEGEPEYDPDVEGVILLGGTKTYSGTTDGEGKLEFQQMSFANNFYVTQHVNLEAEDGAVIE